MDWRAWLSLRPLTRDVASAESKEPSWTERWEASKRRNSAALVVDRYIVQHSQLLPSDDCSV